jgi:sporulation protein YlmC with PRC-barrel domain
MSQEEEWRMQQTTTDITQDQIRASKVDGTSVYNRAGEKLGHVDDIVLNKRDGRATVAIMSFGGFLGIGEQYHPLPWSSLNYDPGRGGYVVDVTREQLEGGPSYRRDEEPDWNDRAYGERMPSYYGLPRV